MSLAVVTPLIMERLEMLAKHWFVHRSKLMSEPVSYMDVLTEITADYQIGALTNDLLENLLDGYETRRAAR